MSRLSTHTSRGNLHEIDKHTEQQRKTGSRNASSVFNVTTTILKIHETFFSGDNICNAYTNVCVWLLFIIFNRMWVFIFLRCRSRKKCKFIVAGHLDWTNLNWCFQASLEREFNQIRLELQLVMRRWHGLRQALEFGLHCCWLLINFDWRSESWEICRLQNAFCDDNLISLNVNSIIPDLWRWFCLNEIIEDTGYFTSFIDQNLTQTGNIFSLATKHNENEIQPRQKWNALNSLATATDWITNFFFLVETGWKVSGDFTIFCF